MKYIINYLSLFLLLSPCSISYAMEKEQPPIPFSFKQLLNPVIKPFTDFQQAAKEKEQATDQLVEAVIKTNLHGVNTALKNGADHTVVGHIPDIPICKKALVSILHKAVSKNNSEIISALLNAGAKPFAHQSYFMIRADEIFPLSLLPIAITEDQKYHRSIILQSFAQTIAKKNLKSDYESFVTHIRKLTDTYNTSNTSQSSEKDHIEDQVEIVRSLNFNLITLNQAQYIPNPRNIFVITQSRESASYMFYEQTSESGLPLLDIHVCNSMKLLMELNKIYPNHPTIKLYKHLCNIQSEYNAHCSF